MIHPSPRSSTDEVRCARGVTDVSTGALTSKVIGRRVAADRDLLMPTMVAQAGRNADTCAVSAAWRMRPLWLGETRGLPWRHTTCSRAATGIGTPTHDGGARCASGDRFWSVVTASSRLCRRKASDFSTCGVPTAASSLRRRSVVRAPSAWAVVCTASLASPKEPKGREPRSELQLIRRAPSPGSEHPRSRTSASSAESCVRTMAYAGGSSAASGKPAASSPISSAQFEMALLALATIG
eukprot:scaffold304522_cov25-Tisochrysis_lutea.AAC.2